MLRQYGFVVRVMAVLFVFTGVSQSGDQISVKGAPSAAQFSEGERLYARNCASCHGVQGDGHGPAAYLLYPKPRDFTQGLFKLISTDNQQVSNRDLYQVITRGIPGSSMPSWDTFSEESRWALVYYVRYLVNLGERLREGTISMEEVREGLPLKTKQAMAGLDVPLDVRIQVPAEPVATAKSILRGKGIYAQACALCHGPKGRGDGKQVLQDAQGLPVKARDLTAGIFKGSSSSEELWYRVNAGIPGTPMPGYRGVYTDQELWDLVHFIQTLPAKGAKGAEERSRYKRESIVARRVAGRVDAGPFSNYWEGYTPVFVSLIPLWWRDQSMEGVRVRAVHNGRQLALHLSWAQARPSDSTRSPQLFSDGAAIQFSTEESPPFFAMGEKGHPVTFWHWKAAWERDLTRWADVEETYPHMATDWYSAQKNYSHGSSYEVRDSDVRTHDPQFITGWGAGNPLSDPNRATSAEEARAVGFGSLTSVPPGRTPVRAQGVWKDGEWRVVFVRDLTADEKDRLQLQSGRRLHVAFAVWNGSVRDRNGQKSVSLWNELSLDR